MRSIKVALVYDRVNKWGGAERVLLALHELFPDAPLYTSVYHPEKAAWASVFQVKPSILQKFPLAKSFHQLYAPLMPLAFGRFSFAPCDLVISVTSEAAKSIQVPEKTWHICYCLTPTRYLWSGYKEYFKHPLFRFFAFPLISVLRTWDLAASKRPDMFVAISEEVRTRIKKYYHRESVVVYPPVEVSSIKYKGAGSRERTPKENYHTINQTPNTYFLVVSRLVPYKRVDLAIKACNKLKLPLVIVGKGSEEEYLREIAGETIFFAGHLTQEMLLKYYKESKGLLFPGREDFGLVIVEAQRLGKPVIAFRGGGALETIIEGKTGIFFDRQNVSSLVEALQRFEKKRFNPAICRKQAKNFSFEKFAKAWKRVLNSQPSFRVSAGVR